MCEECYSDRNRITPLRNPLECLEGHTQYICGTCGRCICIEKSETSGLQRWNFPFRSLDEAKLYLRTADYSMEKPCGIYEIMNQRRVSYKIFSSKEELQQYLKKNRKKTCPSMEPVFSFKTYRLHPKTQVRSLSADEVKEYMSER